MISDNDNQLLNAIGNGDLAVVKMRLSKGANPNVISPKYDGLTPLVAAAMGGFDEIAKELIASGADVNWAGYNTGTPLYWAIIGGHAKVVKVLLDAGVDPNARCHGDSLIAFNPLRAVEIHSAVGDLTEVKRLITAAIEATRQAAIKATRHHEEAQKRAVDEERARGEEEVRRRNVRAERNSLKQCELCGESLGFMDRLSGRLIHGKCKIFRF